MFAVTSLTRRPLVWTLLLVSTAVAVACRVGIGAEQHGPAPSAANPQEKSADVKSPPARGAAASLCDANCAKRATDAAGQACVPLIEAKAPIDYDWLARPFGGIFQQVERSPESSVVSYRGDAIRFLTPQNQWIRVTYECGYDVALAKIVFVNVRPGRLDRPASASLEQPNDQKQPALVQRPAPQAPQLSQVALPQAPNQPGNPAAGPTLPPSAGKTPVHYGEPSVIDVSQLPARR